MKKSKNIKTIILGAGPTGLSAAYHLTGEKLIIEREERIGGLARSIEKDGFIFDFAGHIIFSQDAYANRLIKKLLGKNIHYQDREAWVYSKGTYTRYPFQANTHGLPKDVVKEILLGVIKAQADKGAKRPKNFEEWIVKTFGEGIAKHFMLPYNKKVWGVPLADMSYEWIADRVMTPTVEEVLEGALESKRAAYGPNSRFAYPLRGGSQAFMESFLPNLKKTEIALNSDVKAIDIDNKVITLRGGREIGYDRLISTIPITELVSISTKVKKNILNAADRLCYTSVYCINVAIDHPEITEKNWIYYPETDVIYQRLFIQGKASPHLTPKGKSSITAEISYSQHKPLNKKRVAERVVNDLIKTGFISKKKEVDFTLPIDMKYGYIIFNKDRKRAVGVIRNFFRDKGIISAGRFGEWEYYNMDHAILSGRRAALDIKKI